MGDSWNVAYIRRAIQEQFNDSRLQSGVVGGSGSLGMMCQDGSLSMMAEADDDLLLLAEEDDDLLVADVEAEIAGGAYSAAGDAVDLDQLDVSDDSVEAFLANAAVDATPELLEALG